MFSPVFILSVVVLAVSAKSIEDVVSREEAETERIVGGRNAANGQFPWAVALHYNGQFICTASIISPTTVLTAAHCVVLGGEQQPADNFYAIANVNRSAASVRIDFATVQAHPNYNDQSIDNDVAVFKTTQPIEFNDEVKPVCIAAPDTPMYEFGKTKATVMGWGNTSPIRIIVNIPERLQFVEQRIVRNTFCSLLNPGVNEDKLCATGLLTGVCNGDSGGPLVILSNPPVEIGVTSYINGLAGCGKGVPAVFTRVSSFYDFIMQEANDDSICTV